ncbi:MAG: fibrillarin-like rRNA/tRNA 2'-O-methyltransferase [Methanolinea sp.]|jgi:fibrillarin-like pre-rRNA processing protein|nr:fibrillarin-like rRNA/tRNA 2'-O-methyltransferase [Methanolinea sp.]
MIWEDGILVSRGEGGVYGERVLRGQRVWNPYRSKLAAYYYRGGDVDIDPSLRVLYLGAAHGTTVSHVADYAETVYAVENAYAPMRDLLAVAARRENIIPLFADATRPNTYAPLVEMVQLLFQDVAHPDQAGIARANSVFLGPGGVAILAIKTRSIDVSRSPRDVVDDTCAALAGSPLTVEKELWLEPYHHDHAILVCKKQA